MSDVRPETIWNRPARGARGPKGELGRDRLAATGIDLADAGGLRSVTMRAVADTLGTTAGGLYRYVRSRDELVALMVDAVLAELHVPAPEGRWQDQILAVATDQLRLYLAHPWLAEPGLGSGPAGPHALTYFDRCLSIMVAVPASNAAKMEALAILTGVVSLFARAASTQPVDPRVLFSGLDPGAQPTLAAALASTDPPAARPDLFARTIHSLLSGLLPATPQTSP